MQIIFIFFGAIPAIRYNPRKKAWDFHCYRGYGIWVTITN